MQPGIKSLTIFIVIARFKACGIML